MSGPLPLSFLGQVPVRKKPRKYEGRCLLLTISKLIVQRLSELSCPNGHVFICPNIHSNTPMTPPPHPKGPTPLPIPWGVVGGVIGVLEWIFGHMNACPFGQVFTTTSRTHVRLDRCSSPIHEHMSIRTGVRHHFKNTCPIGHTMNTCPFGRPIGQVNQAIVGQLILK